MSLVIGYNDGSEQEIDMLGEGLSQTPDKVKFVRASKDELWMIRNHTVGLLDLRADCVRPEGYITWYGVPAQFIAANFF